MPDFSAFEAARELPVVTFFRAGRRLGEVVGEQVTVDRNETRLLVVGTLRPCVCACEEITVMCELATPAEEQRVEVARVVRENETAMRALDATAYRFGADVEVACDTCGSWLWSVSVEGDVIAEGISREEAIRIGHEVEAKRRREVLESTHEDWICLGPVPTGGGI